MNRYSAGHRVVHAGAYLLPLLPVLVVSERYSRGAFEFGDHHVALLWLTGLLISYALIFIHELGHVVAARCVGLKIAEMTIGHWRRLFSFNIGGMRVVFRAAPDSGFVRPEPSPVLASGWRMALFFAGGIAAELLVLLLAWRGLEFPRQVGTFGELFSAFSFVMLMWLGSIHVLKSLWPHEGVVGANRHPTDGALLLALWRSRRRPTNHAALIVLGLQVDGLIREGRIAEAQKTLEELRALSPENTDLTRAAAVLHAESGDTRRGEALLRELLALPLGAQKLAEILDLLACLPLYHGRPDLLDEADRWSNEALRLAPGAITLKGTRGSVLVEQGKADEGMALLREVIKHSECPVDQTVGAAFLAKAHHLRGERAEARRWLEKAKATGANPRVVARIAAELDGPANSAAAPAT